MLSVRKITVLFLTTIIFLGLAGCAGRELQRTDGYIRPATSMSFRLYIPNNQPIRIIRHGYGHTPIIGNADRARANKELSEMFSSMEKQLNTRFSEVLTSSNTPSGDDLVIAIDVEDLVHNDLGPFATINVRALFKNPPAGSSVHSFKFIAGTGANENPEMTATKFVNKIMGEIQTTGMINPPKK